VIGLPRGRHPWHILRVNRRAAPRVVLVVVLAVVVIVTGSVASCLTLFNGVVFEPLPDAPVLEARPEGCIVEVVEDGTTSQRKARVIGRVKLDWSREQMQTQGAAGALKTLRAAACERGAHLVLDMRALPKTPDPGVVYEADLAVLLNDDGEPLVASKLGPKPSPAAPASSASSASTSSPSPASPATTAPPHAPAPSSSPSSSPR
jgi:hypothetical protein